MYRLFISLFFLVPNLSFSQDIINSNPSFLQKESFEHLTKEIVIIKNEFDISMKIVFPDNYLDDFSQYTKNDKSWILILLSKNDEDVKILKSTDLSYLLDEQLLKIKNKDILPQIKKENFYYAALLSTLEIKSILLNNKYKNSAIEPILIDYDTSLNYALGFFAIASIAYIFHIFRKQNKKREWQKTLKVQHKQVPKVNEKLDININYAKTVPISQKTKPNLTENTSNQYLNLNTFDYSTISDSSNYDSPSDSSSSSSYND